MFLHFLHERQKWWHGGAGLTERSERGTLYAVVTHVLFVFFILFGRKGRVIETTIAWLIVTGSFIGGLLFAEWLFDHRNLPRSRLRSLASWMRLSIAIFCDVALCRAAICSLAERIRASRCSSDSDLSSSISRKNFSCRANSRHCKTPPNMNASDAPKNISQTCIQSKSDGIVLISETNTIIYS